MKQWLSYLKTFSRACTHSFSFIESKRNYFFFSSLPSFFAHSYRQTFLCVLSLLYHTNYWPRCHSDLCRQQVKAKHRLATNNPAAISSRHHCLGLFHGFKSRTTVGLVQVVLHLQAGRFFTFELSC